MSPVRSIRKTAEKWTIEAVMNLRWNEVIDIWKTLPAPDFDEMDGEYAGCVPCAHNRSVKKHVEDILFDEFSALGYWLGKAYKPLSPTSGEGYNVWRKPGGKVVRNVRFATEMGVSFIDGNPALLMHFEAFNCGNRQVDEIRKLDDGLYLGIGTRPLADGSRSEPGHFAMNGPINRWIGPDADWNKWTLERLMRLGREEVIELWRTLQPPGFEELNGEYAAYIPNGRDEREKRRVAEAMFNECSPSGYWLGKGFNPTSATEGEGYNCWRRLGGKIVRNLSFSTEIGSSLIDHKPAYIIHQGILNGPAGEKDRIDEIRKLDDGLYVACTTKRKSDGSRTSPEHSIFIGPSGPWIGPDK